MIEELPDVPGLRERWGQSVFSCPYCDGWEMRDRPLAIAGDRKNLVSLAQQLYQWSTALTICGLLPLSSTSDEAAWVRQTGVATKSAAIVTLEGPSLTLKLDDGSTLACEALFLSVPLVFQRATRDKSRAEDVNRWSVRCRRRECARSSSRYGLRNWNCRRPLGQQ